MYTQIIKNISSYVKPEKREIDLITSFLKYRKIKKNQFLLQRGEDVFYDSHVNKGCLKASYIDPKGKELIVKFAIEDWWITDYDSYINREPARLEILALEDSELLQVDRESLDKIFDACPSFERAYRIMMQRSFISLNRCLISFLSGSAEERYLEFVREHPGFVNRIPQYQIASYLGMSPEYLSRIRSKLTVNGT
jgi:CRP/FNR family transcriptional regulator, anaerobic regulatory protein